MYLVHYLKVQGHVILNQLERTGNHKKFLPLLVLRTLDGMIASGCLLCFGFSVNIHKQQLCMVFEPLAKEVLGKYGKNVGLWMSLKLLSSFPPKSKSSQKPLILTTFVYWFRFAWRFLHCQHCLITSRGI